MSIIDSLKSLSAGEGLSREKLKDLYNQELTNSLAANPWEITAENGLEKIQERSFWFTQVYPQVKQLSQQLGLKDSEMIGVTLWRLWLPLALQLAEAKQRKGSPYIVGILGGQGTGKTTLTTIIHTILAAMNYRSFGFSIDDIYKTYQERQLLKTQEGLIWRGPPGTHDLEAGLKVLDQVLQTERTEPILIPRFKKSLYNGEGDRIEPQPLTGVIDIVIFEGWFVGVRPLDDTVFESLSCPIACEDKPFARSCNQRLKDYLPLWERLDYLIILNPRDYRLSKQWRKEAEHQMRSRGENGMSDDEIEQFVDYFWQALHPELFITPLTQNPGAADLVVEINSDHSPGKIYKPQYSIS
ncbi:hypothetical protein [Gloeothece verrucosa]|uniref:Glycerate kinase n=1 Tax=Gloeothece verrucosa (strain PCC 7822) TaxID=497965 RepID=E0UG23_GLOV7|nr:hypothetical protein [Gloeothece verrucosa]ADN15524.1 conserved hypothetical protein [Gloeothece verrucosa PCC 7822]